MNVNTNLGRSDRFSTPRQAEANDGELSAGLRDEMIVGRGGGGVDENGDEQHNEKEGPVTWRSLPHKRQLVILTLARLSEPLVQTSLQVFIFVFLEPAGITY